MKSNYVLKFPKNEKNPPKYLAYDTNDEIVYEHYILDAVMVLGH